jgi:glycosyltransferase involved in cell wall biosynthesis
MQIRVDGPVTGSYSLSLVNREMALALEALRPGTISLSFECRPDSARYDAPEPAFLEDHPEVAALWQHGRRMKTSGEMPAVVLLNSWPPLIPAAAFAGAGSGRPPIFLTNAYGWEESRFPQEHAAAFNRRLDGLTLMSRFVAKTLVDNGVHRPMEVVGLGADHVGRIAPVPVDVDLGDGYRFLHVSSCFPRKGLDVLLEAYGRAFTAADPVTLVIKTFPNPHNDAGDQVARFRQAHPAPPAVVLIDADLPPGAVVDLYRRCHCLVAPSRGEGFGLPLAEAMLLELPVITTAYGGQLDFCTPETARLIRCRLQPARSHLNPFASVWAEPDVDDLCRLMREQVAEDPASVGARTAAARQCIEGRFTWRACARRVLDFIAVVQKKRPSITESPRPPRPRAALVTTWNSRCGIAEYSRQMLPGLLDQMEVVVVAPRFGERIRADEPNVRRVWCPDDFCDTIPRLLAETGIHRVVINFHFSFFSLPGFVTLLERLQGQGVAVTVIFHAFRDALQDIDLLAGALAKAHRLLVHNVEDLNRLRALGLAASSALLPHGVPGPVHRFRPPALVLPPAFRRDGFIAAFGFLMPHKGMLELIAAFARLAPVHRRLNLLLLTSLYPKDEVLSHHRDCRRAIEAVKLSGRIRLVTDFLPDEEVLALLSRAKLVVFPYQHSAESSSAAVRQGLAVEVPTAVTPLPIFDDVASVTHRLPGTSPADLAEGIDQLLGDPDRLAAVRERQRQWRNALQWPVISRMVAGLVQAPPGAHFGNH